MPGLPLLRRVPSILCLAASSGFVAAMLWVAFARIAYPFELEWMEGCVLDHVHRAASGEPIYVAPTLEFVPFIYTPLYYYLGAAFRMLGEGFWPLRLLSLLSSLGSLALIFLWVRKHCDPVSAGIAAGLFAAAYPIAGFWYDVGRVDALFVFLLLCGIRLLDGPAETRRLAAAAILFSLAYHTKQAALPVIACLAPMALGGGARPALAFLGTLALGIPGLTWAMDRLHDGWYAYYTLYLPSRHGRELSMWTGFWTLDMLPAFPIPFLLGAAAVAGRLLLGERRGAMLLALASAGMVGTSWMSRLHSGGWVNVLLPACAWLCIMAGLGLGWFRGLPGLRGAVGLAAIQSALLWQFAHLAYDPRGQIPDDRDRRAGEATVEALRAMPGNVWVANHGYLAAMAGKPAMAHSMAALDVLRVGGNPAGDTLFAEIERALGGHRIPAIVTDYHDASGSWILPHPLAGRYVAADSLPDPRAFLTRTGIGIRPIYILKPGN
jgi:hypothetical protein